GRLAAVDASRSSSAAGVREELIATIDDHLQHLAGPPSPRQGDPFRFLQVHLIPVPSGHQARTLAEFRDALALVDASALFYHVIEARYREQRGRGDFAEWIDTGLGRSDIAERLAHIDPYVGNLERLRDRLPPVLGPAVDQERG